MFLSSGTQKIKEFSRRTRKFTAVDSQPRRRRNSRESAILFPFSSINPHLSPSLLLTQNQASSTLNSLIPSKTSMSIIRRSNIFDPFDIGNPFECSNSSTETSAFAGTRIDWKETPEAHIFKADLPGVKKEEVKVEVVEGDVLQISGERKEEKEEKNDRWHRVERSSGKFLRRFRLPENVKVHQVKAAMENGVLSVVVPKEEVKKSEVKSIEISG